MRSISIAVALLSISLIGCGGGSSNKPSAPGPQFYLPLAVGNTWVYDCGNQVAITDTVTQMVTVNGQQAFALQLQFPNGPTQTFLLSNDTQGNTTFHGYLVNGVPTPVTPTAYIAAKPNPGQAFNYPSETGGTIARVFVVFESTNPTPLGTFEVASYNDNGTQDIWGYALGKGIAEQDHGTFDCKVKSIQIH